MSKKERKSSKRVPPEAGIIGKNLQDLRLERNLSRRTVARILGISFQQIQKYESGQNRFPLDRLYKIKHYFNVPYERFFEGLECCDAGDCSKDRTTYGLHLSFVKLEDFDAKTKNTLGHLCLDDLGRLAITVSAR